jgi:hypothetical protein
MRVGGGRGRKPPRQRRLFAHRGGGQVQKLENSCAFLTAIAAAIAQERPDSFFSLATCLLSLGDELNQTSLNRRVRASSTPARAVTND